MEAAMPIIDDEKMLEITTLGEAKFESPLKKELHLFVQDNTGVVVYSRSDNIAKHTKGNHHAPMFEVAGARQKIFFDPKEITIGIVTCSGLCPGLNDVIRSVTLTAKWQYGVKKVIGFKFGFEGLLHFIG